MNVSCVLYFCDELLRTFLIDRERIIRYDLFPEKLCVKEVLN